VHTRNERGQYPAIVTEQAWSIKDYFIIWKSLEVIPSRQGSTIFPAQEANHSAGFGSSCQLIKLANVIQKELSVT